MPHAEKNPAKVAVFQILQGRTLVETAERAAALIVLGGDPDSPDTLEQQCELLRAGLLLAIAHLRIAESLVQREEPTELQGAAARFARELSAIAKGADG